jgi:hypothetical protein
VYLTCYVRLAIDPDTSLVTLHGDTVYYGGLYDDYTAAEACARECVRTDWEGFGKAHAGKPRGDTVRGLILPRVFTLDPGDTVTDALYKAQGWFERKLAEMNEAIETIEHAGC